MTVNQAPFKTGYRGSAEILGTGTLISSTEQEIQHGARVIQR
jgi:hypothetical protein